MPFVSAFVKFETVTQHIRHKLSFPLLHLIGGDRLSMRKTAVHVMLMRTEAEVKYVLHRFVPFGRQIS